MNGIQLLALVGMIALGAWAVRQDRTKWANLARAAAPAPRRQAPTGPRPVKDESWIDDVQAWGDELDGTAQLRRATTDLARANVYATVSADVAAQQARVRGEVA